jgi:hypothetical protein
VNRRRASNDSVESSIPANDRHWLEHREALLDDALDDTFPASDPPAIVMPRRPRRSRRMKRDA